MSTHAFNRALQFAYPAVIFLALLASAGMSLVQAGSPDMNHLFPDRGNRHIDRTLVSTQVSACSIQTTQNPNGELRLCGDSGSSKTPVNDRTYVNRDLPEIGPYRLNN